MPPVDSGKYRRCICIKNRITGERVICPPIIMPIFQPRVVSNIVRSPYERKSALVQAKSTLHGLHNLAILAPVPGLVACVPIVVSIIDSIEVSITSEFYLTLMHM